MSYLWYPVLSKDGNRVATVGGFNVEEAQFKLDRLIRTGSLNFNEGCALGDGYEPPPAEQIYDS